MNSEKYTERAKGFLQAAQTLATTRGHQRLMPEHVLKVLLDDKEGGSAPISFAPRAAIPEWRLRRWISSSTTARGR